MKNKANTFDINFEYVKNDLGCKVITNREYSFVSFYCAIEKYREILRNACDFDGAEYNLTLWQYDNDGYIDRAILRAESEDGINWQF